MSYSRSPNKPRTFHFRKSLKEHFLKIPNKHQSKTIHKFFSSNFEDEVSSQSEFIIQDETRQEQVLSYNSNLITNYIYLRPNINSKMINTIFDSQHKTQQKQSYQINSKSATSLFQIVDNIAQKTINDYIVEKIKKQINKNKNIMYDENFSTESIYPFYEKFIESFNLENMKKFFKCLNNVKSLTIDKYYIINNVYFYFKKKNLHNQYRDPELFSEIKLKNQLINLSQESLNLLKSKIADLQNNKNKIKEHFSKKNFTSAEKIKIKIQCQKINTQIGILNSKLTKEQEKLKRLLKEKVVIRQQIKNKIDNIITSGQYFEQGYGKMYAQIVEADIKLEDNIISNLLNKDEIEFLKKKSKIETEINNLNKKLREMELHSISKIEMGRIKNQIYKLKNELIIIQQNILEKIKKQEDVEKHIYSLFGNGQNGIRIYKKIKGMNHNGSYKKLI